MKRRILKAVVLSSENFVRIRELWEVHYENGCFRAGNINTTVTTESVFLRRWVSERKMKHRCGVVISSFFIATQKATPSEMAGAQALKLYALSNSIRRKCLKSSAPTRGIVEIVNSRLWE